MTERKQKNTSHWWFQKMRQAIAVDPERIRAEGQAQQLQSPAAGPVNTDARHPAAGQQQLPPSDRVEGEED